VGVLDQAQLATLLDAQKAGRKLLGQVLLEQGTIDAARLEAELEVHRADQERARHALDSELAGHPVGGLANSAIGICARLFPRMLGSQCLPAEALSPEDLDGWPCVAHVRVHGDHPLGIGLACDLSTARALACALLGIEPARCDDALAVDALGQDPAQEGLQITTAKGDDSEVARVVSRAIAERRMLELEHYKEELDEFTTRRVEPYKLMNGQEGWYVHVWDPEKDDTRSFRLDRIRSATVLDEEFERRPGIEPDIHGWPSTGEVADSRTARVWVAPEPARWAREERHVIQELADGAVIVEMPFAGHHYLAREILKNAGDAVVLEPDDARQAVLEAAESLAGAAKR
jgi:hypothetical protein